MTHLHQFRHSLSIIRVAFRKILSPFDGNCTGSFDEPACEGATAKLGGLGREPQHIAYLGTDVNDTMRRCGISEASYAWMDRCH